MEDCGPHTVEEDFRGLIGNSYPAKNLPERHLSARAIHQPLAAAVQGVLHHLVVGPPTLILFERIRAEGLESPSRFALFRDV
jgi:hypothetical protein